METIEATVNDLEIGDVFSFPGQYGTYKLLIEMRAWWPSRRRVTAVDAKEYDKVGRITSELLTTAPQTPVLLKRKRPVLIHARPGPYAPGRGNGEVEPGE